MITMVIALLTYVEQIVKENFYLEGASTQLCKVYEMLRIQQRPL